MVYKVDGGSVSNYRKEEPAIKKPEVKPAVSRTEPAVVNAAVYTNKSETNQLANNLKLKLNAQFAPALQQTPPTLTPDEAKQKADEIIKNNGGKDHLNTEGVGRDLADIAKTNPADAWAIAHAMLGDSIDENDKGKIKEEDKDEIAQSFTNNLSDSDIATLAQDGDGRALLDRMQHHLLSGSVHPDEYATADRIQKELVKTRTFSDWYQGIDEFSPQAMEGNVGAASDPNATPEEAAAALKSPYGPNDIESDVNTFTDQLDAHKNDPKWLQGYYAALGSDKTAELINGAATTSAYSAYMTGMGGNPQVAGMYNKNMATIAASLETLRQSGGLSQTDMNNLVGALQKNNFQPNLATDLFGKASPQLQELFVKGTIANGNDQMEAAGSYVLAQLPGDKQAAILGSLNDTQLKNFIKGAMAGQSQAIDMNNYLSTGIADKYTTMGGVEKLMQNAVGQTFQYYPYSYEPFSEDLQNKLFSAVADGLNSSKAFDNFKDNPDFKDTLSKLFMRNGTDILKSQAPDGAFQDSDFITGMSKFFELTLFSPNGGKLRGDLMASVVKTMGDVGDASKNPPLSQSDYEKLHNGWSQQDHVEVMGGLLGMVWQAAANQKSYIQNDIMQDAAKKKEMVGFFVGMAFSFVPGAGDVFGKIAGEGASFLEKIPDKIVDFAWDKTKDQLKDGSQDFLLDLLKGASNSDALANVDMLADKFKEVIVATNAALPNGEAGELNLRSAFQSAFSFYHDLVDFN
jgi:hypothetical protein